MNVLSQELQAVADALAAAGTPATVDPGMLLQMVATHSVAALIVAPDEVRFALGMAAIDLDVRVWLCTYGPDDAAAADRLFTSGLLAWPAAVPLALVTRDSYTSGETSLPALRWDTARRVPYPDTASSHIRSVRHGS